MSKNNKELYKGDNKMAYYRVECVSKADGLSRGGVVAVIETLYALILGVRPDDPFIEIRIAQADNPDVSKVTALAKDILSMAVPKEYEKDKSRRCYYTKSSFEEVKDSLTELARMFEKQTSDKFTLKYKTAEIADTDLIFKDKYQIVVSKEVDEKATHEYINF